MEKKIFKSLVKRITWWPLFILVSIMTVMIISCVISFQKMQKELIAGNLNSIRVTMAQLSNVMARIDNEFLNYISQEDSYKYMSLMDKATPYSEYLQYESQTRFWLEKQRSSMDAYIDGFFAYYENLDSMVFRSDKNRAVHSYIQEKLLEDDQRYNQWQIVEISDSTYLLCMNKYNEFYYGCWVKLSRICTQLGFESSNYLGIVYLADQSNSHIFCQDYIEIVNTLPMNKNSITLDGIKYRNYNISIDNYEHIKAGILIPQSEIINNIPVLNKFILGVAIGSLALIPIIIRWMRRKIADPITELSSAMERFGKGDMDFRIPETKDRCIDELDLLKYSMNQMMDAMNDLQIRLYKTKMKEQETQLKYISQQIRPHFILNALNSIYTCRKDEMDNVKKMILYLTNYFRYIVNLNVDYVELEKELNHIRNYLKIQKERYGERFSFIVEWEQDVSQCSVPPLIVQTFVENCVKYGFYEGKIFIFVLASIDQGELKIVIADNGHGFEAHVLEKLQLFSAKREFQEELGIGIQNAVERLDILYGGKEKIIFRNALSGGAVVEIYLPAAVL